MKSTIAFCVFFFAAVTLARPDGDHYTDKYDDINLREIISNDRLLEGYFDCVMEKGKCTAEGKELKAHIKDALETECAHCTQKQKEGTELVIGHLINHKPDMWTELCNKYDPDRKYSAKYEKHLKRVKA